MMAVCLILDGVGVQLGLWMYVYDIFPFIPGYIPWDLTIFPIETMIFIEIKPKSSPFIKALIFAALNAFIGEPLADFSKIYEPIHWKVYYSFPIYIVLFLICNKVARSKIFNSTM
ncbi:CBO0543 family protein [Bacillus salipaludis]|uniref:CBO0543 family protein n=1 Tax=Bacillus salipaludis TaxID=2547811 RepID=UPI003D22381B